MSGRGKGGKVCAHSVASAFVSNPLQGLGKGGAKRHRKILRDNIQGNSLEQSLQTPLNASCRYHQARYPPSGPPWRCQAYLWSHLRRDPWCSQDLPRECASYCLLMATLLPNSLSPSSRSSATQSHTQNTRSARLSLHLTSSTHLSARDAPSTVSVLKHLLHFF